MPILKTINALCKTFKVRCYYPDAHGMIGIKKDCYYHWFRSDGTGCYRKAETTKLIKAGARRRMVNTSAKS